MNPVILGTNIYRSRSTPIGIRTGDRLRHMYMLGKTGVGKSTLFQNLALQDIRNGSGLCFIDPHGESVEWILSKIPTNRLEDVILFDPADTDYPLGLNLLEAETEIEKDFLVNELIQIFYKLFDPNKTGVVGPQFEHWLRNAALTVMSGAEGGSLIEIPRLFIDSGFLKAKMKHVKDEAVRQFWEKQIASTADFHKSEMLNYFSSKFGAFINNRMVRNIIGQRKSSYNFKEILANDKIILVNLSKGKTGELNAHMLGLIIIAKLQAAVLQRANLSEKQRNPFFLYVDEFQNLVTDTFASMLSESRKYGLGVHLTNQYFAQLPESMRDAILGNVGTLLLFGVGVEDAEAFAKEFQPFSTNDIVNLEKFQFYVKLMIDGKMSEAFSGTSLAPLQSPEKDFSEHIKEFCRLAYGLPQLLVSEELKQIL